MSDVETSPGASEAGTSTESPETPIGTPESGAEHSEEGGAPKPAAPDRFSRQLAKVAQREQEALRAQREAKREIEEARREIEQAKHWRGQIETKAGELLAIKRESEELKTLLRDLHEGPNAIAALKRLGVDFEKLVENVAESGTPNAQIRSARAELDRKLEKIEKWQQEQEEARQRYLREQEQQKYAQETQQLIDQRKREVIDVARASTNKYPEIGGLSDRRLLTLFEEKAYELAVPLGRKQTGEVEYRWPTLDKVFSAMENDLAEEDKGRSAHRAKRSSSASSTSSPGSSPQPGNGRSPSDGGSVADEDALMKAARIRRESARPERSKPKTLTNEHAAVVATQKSTRPQSGSREELRRMLVRKYLVPSSQS